VENRIKEKSKLKIVNIAIFRRAQINMEVNKCGKKILNNK